MPLEEEDRAAIRRLEEKLRPIEAQIAPLQAQARKWRSAINAFLEAAGEPPAYDLAADDSTGGSMPIRAYGRREFFDKPLATVVAQILKDRDALDEHEIYELMLSGGYVFKESDPERAKSNMKISLGKNTRFSKTGRGHYVLASKPPRQRANAGEDAESRGEPEGASLSSETNGNTPPADGPETGEG